MYIGLSLWYFAPVRAHRHNNTDSSYLFVSRDMFPISTQYSGCDLCYYKTTPGKYKTYKLNKFPLS